MTVMTRDVWADAHQAATAEVLDRDLAAVRRHLRLRSVLGLVLGCGALLAVFWLIDLVFDPDGAEVWSMPFLPLWVTFGLMGLALVLLIVGGIRTIGFSQPFVAPDAFLTRTDRAWLRTQVAEGRPVPDERRAVVADTARGMVAEGRKFPTYLALTAVFLGVILGGSPLGTFVMFSALILWMLVRIVRGAVWSRRARHWLAQNA